MHTCFSAVGATVLLNGFSHLSLFKSWAFQFASFISSFHVQIRRRFPSKPRPLSSKVPARVQICSVPSQNVNDFSPKRKTMLLNEDGKRNAIVMHFSLLLLSSSVSPCPLVPPFTQTQSGAQDNQVDFW